jgi:WG repeat protein/PKD domain-containing protein
MKVILITILLLSGSETSYAKEWRGIVPLRSTRSDVVRLLNQCSDQIEACRFTLETENVHILFSGGLAAAYHECAKRLPPETVMFVAVEPQVNLKLDDLHLDKRTLQSFNPAEPVKGKLKGYFSTDGLVTSLFKDTILQIFYIAGESDKGVCADYYVQPQSFVAVPQVHVPEIYSITGPPTINAGERLIVSADSNMNEILGYEWTLTGGRIISGQYTKQITIDTTGLAGQKITVTAEIEDGSRHRMSGSITVEVLTDNPSLAQISRKEAPYLFPISQRFKFGYINRRGRMVIKPRFDSARGFSEGLARVQVNQRYGFIDTSGRLVITPRFNMANDFSDGLAAVKIPDGTCETCGEWVYINKTGHVVIHTKPIVGTSSYAGAFSEDLASFYDERGQPAFPRNLPYGYIDKSGKIVIPAKFGYAAEFHEGLALVAKDFRRTGWGYIDQQGEYVIEPKFSDGGDFQEGLANIRLDGKWGYIDRAGRLVIAPQFQQASHFSEGYASIMLNEKFGYIDKSGNIVIPPQFDSAGSFSEGFAPVKQGAKIGYINQDGKLVLAIEADEYEEFSGGIAQVSVRYKTNYPMKIGYIDTKGRYIWRPRV